MSRNKYPFYHSYSRFIRGEEYKKYRPTLDEVAKKILSNPVCYLTGELIDFSNAGSYHFDHIIPKSKGGKSSLENLGLTIKDANFAKGNLTIKELLALCKKILRNFKKKGKKMNKSTSQTVNWSAAIETDATALVKFALGSMPKNEFYERFTYTDVGGSIRNMLRTQGTAKSRQLVRRALRRHNVSL